MSIISDKQQSALRYKELSNSLELVQSDIIDFITNESLSSGTQVRQLLKKINLDITNDEVNARRFCRANAFKNFKAKPSDIFYLALNKYEVPGLWDKQASLGKIVGLHRDGCRFEIIFEPSQILVEFCAKNNLNYVLDGRAEFDNIKNIIISFPNKKSLNSYIVYEDIEILD